MFTILCVGLVAIIAVVIAFFAHKSKLVTDDTCA